MAPRPSSARISYRPKRSPLRSSLAGIAVSEFCDGSPRWLAKDMRRTSLIVSLEHQLLQVTDVLQASGSGRLVRWRWNCRTAGKIQGNATKNLRTPVSRARRFELLPVENLIMASPWVQFLTGK